jgi:hypothetical protein
MMTMMMMMIALKFHLDIIIKMFNLSQTLRRVSLAVTPSTSTPAVAAAVKLD